MSTPWAVVAIVGAFLLGLALGVPVAFALVKRRLTAPLAGLDDAVEARPGLIPPVAPASPVSAAVEATLKLKKPAAHRAEYVITSAGEPEGEIIEGIRKEFSAKPQLDRLAKAAMVEAASLAHGVRTALSEENRAKIQYEIKRELIALRKTRKAEVKQALIEYRAKHRGPTPAEGEEGS